MSSVATPRLYKIPNMKKYKINKLGEIYNVEKNKKVATYIGMDCYEHCILIEQGKRYRKRVHRIMGKTFLGNPEVVNHLNGNKSDNKLSNLEASTHSQNIKHAYDNNMYESKKNVKIRLTHIITQVVHDVKSMREAERFTGVDRHRIKTFLQKTRNNHTEWEFEIIKEGMNA